MTVNVLTKNTKKKLLGLGCSTFGGSKSKKTALRTLDAAFDLGVNYFDTARSYGYGQAESIIGQFLKGKRNQVTVTSKFGISPPKPFPFMSQVKDAVRFVKNIAPGISNRVINSYSVSHVDRPVITPRLAIQSLEKSLRELGTDYLDFYLLHDCPYDVASNEDVCNALEKAKKAGMILGWGATCENPDELSKYFQNENPFNMVQFPYSLGNPHLDSSSHQLIKVIFSIMGQRAGLMEPPQSFFDQLYVNQRTPGLVSNLQEAWLFIASRELDNGVVLCSMTQQHHIERNIAILNEPSIPEGAFIDMQRSVLEKSNPTVQLPVTTLQPSSL